MSAKSNQSKNRLAILFGVLAVAAAVVVIAVLVSSSGDDGSSGETQAAKVSLEGIPQNGHVLGDPDAPVTIVEFADPQCPFCRDWEVNELSTVVDDAIRDGRAKLDLRLLTFIGPDSVKAARVMLAAGMQNKMFDVTGRFYANQGRENSGYVTDEWLRDKLGSIPGFDLDKALEEAGSGTVTEQLGEAKSLANRYGVQATPTILVGKDLNNLKAVEAQPVTAAAVLAEVDKLAPPKK
jgi:protein-disulfide isomerase